MTSKSVSALTVISGALLLSGVTYAEKKRSQAGEGQRETVAKPLTEKERHKREDNLRKELKTYGKWINEDVAYIITDEERRAFSILNTDDERQNFIEQFWLRRDPTPDTVENEFKEEHYRRIAYANERFASGIPGWKTDRGHIYIAFGPPSEIDPHPSGGSYERPAEEGGGTTSTYPFEKWRYRWIDGIGTDINIEFVDPTMTGEYRMTIDPNEKDALLRVPGIGLTQLEAMGVASKGDRISGINGAQGNGLLPQRNQFEQLERQVALFRAPKVQFKDLEAQVNSTIKFNLLPMRARADYMRMTNSTVLTNVTLQFDKRDLQFSQKEGVSKAVVNIYARVTSMSRRVVNVFEDVVSVEVPTELLSEAVKGGSLYQKSIPLSPGKYRLNVVAKDIIGNTLNNYEMALNVPQYDDEKLASSTVILADLIEAVPPKSIGVGQFVIGTSKVRPRLSEVFQRGEKLGLYLQLYNFGPDEKTKKPNGSISYEMVKVSNNETVFAFSEEVGRLENSSSNQTTVEKILSLKNLEPGQYVLRMKVTDRNRNQTLAPAASFTVN
jgi:GWxTD domain-containing protein